MTAKLDNGDFKEKTWEHRIWEVLRKLQITANTSMI